MPNNVRNETVKIRNQTLKDLKRIYHNEWDGISEDIEEFVTEMSLNDEASTQAQRLRYAEKSGKKNTLVKLIASGAVLANTKAINRINKGMDKIYNINANDVSKYIYQKTKVTIVTKDINIQSLLGKYTKRRYNNATDNKYVSRQVLGEIDNMLKVGYGTKKIANRLEKVYNFNRTSAFRTTLTETTRIQSVGRFDVMQEASKRGFIFKKIWKHAHYTKRPREWHLEMDGETRDLNKPFSNGLMMPGEAGAPAEEVINCHCYLDEELVDW